MESKKVYITTPIYYASGNPHIGHSYTTILADVLARYKRLLGYDVFFLTGMDEHGQKIYEKAVQANKQPKEFVDEIANKFKDLWSKLDINYSIFARTTNQQHCNCVSKVFQKYLDKDYIYLGNWEGLYCVQCEENYTKSQAIKKERDDSLYCKVGHKLSYKKEESYFLKISSFQNWLKEFLNSNPNFVYPQSRINELNNNFINQGVSDLSISRTTYDWGIKVPCNGKHVIYVWIDALMIYLSGLGYLSNNDELFQKYWNDPNTEIIQLMSKEITRFHCIYWPIMLEMLGLRKPTYIISHGWIITEKGKMSKSLGNVIDPFEYINEYGSDALRYFLIKEISFDKDGIFSKELFINTFNNDLANNYGNLVSRTIGMIAKYTNGVVCVQDANFTNPILDLCNKSIDEIIECIKNNKMQQLVNIVISLGNAANKYIEDTKPWELKKINKDLEISQFLYTLLNVSRIMTLFLSPILTKGTKSATEQLNFNREELNIDSIKDFTKVNNKKIGKSMPIYLRIK